MPSNRTKILIQGLALGLAVVVSIVVPWSLLAAMNLRTSPRVPWAVPLIACYLVGLIAYLNGKGWPLTTADARRRLLRLRWLSSPEWLWALIAGFSAVLALWALHAAVGGLASAPPARSSQLSLSVLIIAICASSAVTAMGEEAGFRGYMQAKLETGFSALTTILIVGIAFTAIHISHGLTGLVRNGAFYFAASCIYSLLSYLTRSILPSLFLHFIGDVFLFSLQSSLFHAAVPENSLARISVGVIALLLAAGCVAAFVRLGRLGIQLNPGLHSTATVDGVSNRG